jgi:1-acyl-sn-glycerol-3-phosphate acyltransferase
VSAGDGFWNTFGVLLRPIVKGLLRLEVRGAEHLVREGALLYVSNHESWWDIPALGVAQPRTIRYMAKSELFRIPVFGRIIRFGGGFPVRRGAADREALRIVHETFADGEVVSIFITGHRQRELTGAKDGAGMLAVVEGVTVIPAAIRGSGGWRPGRRVRVSFGPPRTYARDGRRGRDAYRAAAQDLVEEIGRLYGD